MHLAQIDQISTSGISPFHKAGAFSKLILTVLMLYAFIISNDIIKLGCLIIIVLMLFIIGQIPLKQVGHLALYPAFFSVIFALIKAQEGWNLGLIIILKAVGAAFTMLLLITTTPYVDIFALLSLFMPSLLVDILIFTYRSFFILIDKIEKLLKSMRLRGGYKSLNLFINIKTTASILGVLIIHSFEMSERMYKIYSLRGYKGRIPLEVDILPFKIYDYLIIALGIFIIVGMVIPWSL